jgi:hypothetical protein
MQQQQQQQPHLVAAELDHVGRPDVPVHQVVLLHVHHPPDDHHLRDDDPQQGPLR